MHVLHEHEQPNLVVFQGAHQALDRCLVLQLIHVVLLQSHHAAGILLSRKPTGLARCIWKQENASDRR